MFNFNVIDTDGYQIFSYLQVGMSRTSFDNLMCRVPNLFGQTNRSISFFYIYILTIGNKQFQVLCLTFLFVTNLFFFN